VLYWSQRCQLATDIGGRQDEGACAHAERAAKENVSPDNPGLRATTLLYLAEWDMDQGAFDSARRRVQTARDLVSASGNPVGIGATDYLLGVLDLASGDAQSSAQRFGDAIGNLGHHHPEFRRMNALALRALACSGNPGLSPAMCPADADTLARTELDALPLRWHPRVLPAHVALARMDLQRGDVAPALERLREAIAHAQPDVDASQVRLVEARLWFALAEGASGDCVRAAADAAAVEKDLHGEGAGKHPAFASVGARWPPACGLLPATRP
jgi:hypothetical protein